MQLRNHIGLMLTVAQGTLFYAILMLIVSLPNTIITNRWDYTSFSLEDD